MKISLDESALYAIFWICTAAFLIVVAVSTTNNISKYNDNMRDILLAGISPNEAYCAFNGKSSGAAARCAYLSK